MNWELIKALMQGPSWLDQVKAQSQRDLEAYVRGGVPEMMQDTGETQGLMGGFGGSIKAYHGSPYDFARFDLSKIGTGEGAQAYGHGLYFAENPAVAEEYKRSLSQAQLEKFYDDLTKYGRADRPVPSAGRMYEVNINAEPQQFLQWDKPLGQQAIPMPSDFPTLLRYKYGGRVSPEEATGEQAYQAMGMRVPDRYPTREIQSSSSAALQEAGIPGIRYWDQLSRASGQGTSNYVVFDPDLVDIVKKWALPGMFGAAAGYDQYQSQ